MMTDDMTRVLPPALAYLLPRKESFWRWGADGKAIEWADGRTIVFRDELRAVLDRLAPRGLPPLGAVVLLLAATRGNWASGGNVDAILKGYSELARGAGAGTNPGAQLVLSTIVPRAVRQDIEDVVADLDAIPELPAELRESVGAKCVLADVVFEGAERTLTPDASALAVDAVATGSDRSVTALIHGGHDEGYAALAAELGALRGGLARVSVEPLILRTRTGVDQLVEPAKLDVPAPHGVRRLLRDLRDDPELSGVAKLARDLLAAIHLPRVLVSPEDLPVGGVSDISNRGPLDRLLISELAHDDLTLTVRIALGEALYLRRESPAQHPPMGRAILIDSGIRLWGVPRLFAAAVAMALAAQADASAPMNVYRARFSSVDSVDLTTRDGLVAHLEALESAPHPGAAMQALLDRVDTDQRAAEFAGADIFIVTHEDALSDPHFIRALTADGADREWHVATVSRNGSFALWHLSAAGRRELSRAQLSIDEILSPPRASAPATVPLIAGDPNLPMICAVEPFPLLLPATVDPRHAVASERCGLLAVTFDRRLMQWSSDHKAGRQLASTVPGGRIRGVFLDDDHRLVHVVTIRQRSNKVYLFTADLGSGRCMTREFVRNNPKSVVWYDGVILLVYAKEVRCVFPYDVTENVIKVPQYWRWLNGRFFFDERSVLHAASSRGFEVASNRTCRAAFDREGLGPWLLAYDGEVVSSDGGERVSPAKSFSMPHDPMLMDVSRDGHRIAAKMGAGETEGIYVLDLQARKPKWKAFGKERSGDLSRFTALIGPQLAWSTASSVVIRNHFAGVRINKEAEGRLILRIGGTPMREMAILTNNSGDLILADVGRPSKEDESRPPLHAPFYPTDGVPNTHYTLKVARWSDGSRIYLDSRGMIHLMSSDKRLPQLSFVLSNYPIAGWTSRGHAFGWQFFLPGEATTDAATAGAILRKFIQTLR